MNIVTTLAQLAEVVEAVEDTQVLAFDVETTGSVPSITPGEVQDVRGDTWRNQVDWIAVSNGDQSWVIPMGHPNGSFVEARQELKRSKDLTDRLARGLQPRKSDYSTDPKRQIMVFTEPPAQLTRTEVFGAMKHLFADDKILKVGHNLAFDLGAVTKYVKQVPAGPYFDTMIAAFLVDSGNLRYGLKEVSKLYADIDMVKGVGKNIEKHSFEEVAQYALLDVDATVAVWKVLRERIKTDNLTRVFALEMATLPVVTEMRLTGATIDTETLKGLQQRLERDIEEAKAKIFLISGEKFNINSTPTKQTLLFGSKKEGGRGLQPKMLTAGGKAKKRNREKLDLSDYSVSAEALEMYRNSDPLVDALLGYSDLNKLQSTYVTPYLGGTVTRTVNGKSRLVAKDALLDKGRLHTDFNQIGAATGRFSSRNPNLQNVPSPATEYGKLIRNLFIAPEGHRLVVADYSQIEPRTIATLSRDPIMLDTYKSGGDIYTAIGDTMGVDRKAGKVLVLSIAYGVGADKIARDIGCTVEEAEDLLDEFGQKFKYINKLKAKTIRQARDQAPIPYVGTITGRRRYLPDLNSDVHWQVAKAERQCFNTLIQGSAADIMKIALVRAHSMVPDQSQVILTIHDELVTVAPNHLAEETAEAIREAMEGAMDGVKIFQVPLVADVKIVDKWGQAK